MLLASIKAEHTINQERSVGFDLGIDSIEEMFETEGATSIGDDR